MKQTKKELLLQNSGVIFKENFPKLFSLALFFERGILDNKFSVPKEFDKFIILTDEGENLLENLKKEKYAHIENRIIKFAIFLTFYHEKLFIDVEQIKVNEIEFFLNSEIDKKNILFPWIYDRLLYDKYFEEFEGEDESLSIDDVRKLLNNTPCGVFQIGNYSVGPFGLIKLNPSRFISPTRNVRLWHCSDPSCASFHNVHLEDAKNILNDILFDINHKYSSVKESEWSEFYFNFIETENYYYDHNRTTEIYNMLANGFDTKELRCLLTKIISLNSKIRENFPDLPILKGSPETIANKLDKAQCFQLILLESDKNIIKALEMLIDSLDIDIPPTEIRTSLTKLNGGFYDVKHHCNRLGIRSVLKSPNQSLVRLSKLIESVHDDKTSKEDLTWKLMDYKKDTLSQSIETYVLSEEPRKIIRELILYGPRQTAKAISTFYGNFQIPNNEFEKEFLIDKMLWKLGFDVNIYPLILDDFWKKLKIFRQTTQSDSENVNRDEIRSAAVNFYVLLEEVLEHTLSFITWTLLSDHFIETKFKYNFEEARTRMCDKLNGRKIGKDGELKLDPSGNNNLFGLIEGFTVLVELCDEIFTSENIEQYRKKEMDIPHFHNKSELITFPFPSTLLLLDLKKSDYMNLRTILDQLPRQFNKTNVASIRNRLEHKSRVKDRVDNFPTSLEIQDACDCIESYLKKLEENGIFPNVFLFKSYSIDKFNRVIYELEDYKSHTITLKPLPQFLGSRMPSFKVPQVISSILTVGESGEPVRFTYHETSQYLKFWKNFPRKKHKKTTTQEIENEQLENLEEVMKIINKK